MTVSQDIIVGLTVHSCDCVHYATDAAAKETAKVMFDYEATQADELTIKVDDIVEMVSEEDPRWYVFH